MEIYEMSGERALQLLHSPKPIGDGAYGWVLPYTDDLLFKLYYSEFYDTINWTTMEQLEKNIEDNKSRFGVKDFRRLKEKCERLELCKNGTYIRGIATYKDYPLGIIMKWYKEHQTFEKLCPILSPEQRKYVLSQAKEQLLELIELGIFATDVKVDNILVHPESLDTVLIDLDDDMTAYRKKCTRAYREMALDSYNSMIKTLHYFYSPSSD